MAHTASRPMMVSPMIAEGLRLKRRHASTKTVVCGASYSDSSIVRMACAKPLHFHDDGDDHWTPFGAVVDELLETFVHVLADGGPLGEAFARTAFHDLDGRAAHVFVNALALRARTEREAARGDIWTGQHFSVRTVHGHGHDDHAVDGQMLAIAQHDLAHVADAKPV